MSTTPNEKPKRESLVKLCDEINAKLGSYGYKAQIEDAQYTPRRKPQGLRYFTWEGKTRYGKQLRVYHKDAPLRRVYEYNGLDGFGRLSDVRRWLNDKLEEHK